MRQTLTNKIVRRLYKDRLIGWHGKAIEPFLAQLTDAIQEEIDKHNGDSDDIPTPAEDSRNVTRILYTMLLIFTLIVLGMAVFGCKSAGDNIEKAEALYEQTTDAIDILKPEPVEPDPAPVVDPDPPAAEGDNHFLWKPVSQKNGKLVILFPSSLRGRIESAGVYSRDGALIEKGIFAGDEHNGRRPHYRTGNPGGNYGNNIQARALLKDGSVKSWDIPSGANRVER